MALWLALASAGCGEPEELQASFDEVLPLPADAAFAHRLSLYRFGDQAGGVLRFFELGDGFNDLDAPYLRESYCQVFGPAAITGDSFGAEIVGPDGERLALRVTGINDDPLSARLTPLAAGAEVPELRFALASTDDAVSSECDPRAAFELVVELPELTVDDAATLSLAIAFAGYTYEPALDTRLLRRASAPAVVVDQATATRWATLQRLTFPDVPPARGLSDFEDPLLGGARYSLAYVVLFEDGDEDGAFTHFLLADRVLAVSTSQFVLYLDGDPEDLDETLTSVFDPRDELREGYVLYDADELAVVGQNASVLAADRPHDSLLRLDLLEDGAAPAFPSLLPGDDAGGNGGAGATGGEGAEAQ